MEFIREGSDERDAEEAFQAARDLAVREAGLLIQFDDGGLGIRPQLSGGGAKGVGGLHGMAALDPVATDDLLDLDELKLVVDPRSGCEE